jgi:hypothetical protein
MAKRPPFDPFANGPKGEGERDEQGRFRRGGWKGGPGARLHRYVQQRRALQAAAMAEVSPEELRQLIRALFQAAMDGDRKAAGLILAYVLGRAPEALSPMQMGAPERVARQAPMDIETIAEGLQRLYEEYFSGRVSDTEAGIIRAMLTSLLEARKAGELDAKVSELLAILKERADDAQSS